MLPGGPPTLFHSQDTIPDSDSDTAARFPTEVLNSFNPSGMPPHLLELKIGQPIILLHNVDPPQGLCNGTRLIVQNLGKRHIYASILNGNRMGQEVAIPRVSINSPKWLFLELHSDVTST
jgi:ATP-dependent DNA helicase PIF1